ncbi:MAG: FHIPEP family type III secretion protein [Treponema sp.]|nr:FHIPEP family type III secretion protein [Treponema sp.]
MPETQLSVRDRIFSFVTANALAVGVVLVVLFLFIPLPKVLIDLGMVINLALSLIILLTTVYMRNAADFGSFPQVVLFSTMFGLALNITSTRNILMQHDMNNQSEMVKTFSEIVAGDNLVIGFVIFIILIVVQVLVVTKGAERVSEVKARFTLDAMNNKMFDIQNEFNAGVINEEEASRRKANVRREVAFFSSMDGASKFVSGNVKAGIFITVVNLIGGIVSGSVPALGGNMSVTDALNTYARLTIGDGLMSQLPAIMLSFATGLLVTGSDSEIGLGDRLKKEFTIDGSLYQIVGVVLIVLGIVFHNLSSAALIPVGILFVIIGVRMNRSIAREQTLKKEEAAKASASQQTGSSPDDVSPAVMPEPLALDLGYALVPLVDQSKGAELLDRVTRIRRESALDLGLVMPKIRIRDNMMLAPEEYSFKIYGIEVGKSKLRPGFYMCLNTGGVPRDKEIHGEATVDPAFGMPAVWLPESKRAEAENAGYAVVDPPTIIATHLTEIIRRHAAAILTRQEVSNIIEKVKETNPVVVNEVLTGDHRFTYGEIETVLKNLLAEQVSIRNMVAILETLANFAPVTKDPWKLTERVREALGAQICLQYCDENKVLRIIRMDYALCQKILEKRSNDTSGRPVVAFDPVDGRAYIKAVSDSVAAVQQNSHSLPIILCPSEVRLLVKSSTEREIPGLVVLSINEVAQAGTSIKVEEIGEVHV